MSTDLRADKSSISDDFDDFIEKLRGTEKLRIYMVIDLGKSYRD